MSTPEFAGIDTSGRVRARDIQLAAVADVRRRILMISGAVDTTDHDVSVAVELPEPGRWQVIKAETNLTHQTWVAMQVVTGQGTTIVQDDEAPLMSRQFARSFVTPDLARVTFFDGEVRPGESVLKMYSLDAIGTRTAYAYTQYSPVPGEAVGEGGAGLTLEQVVADGVPQRPVVELSIPVTIVG